MYGYSVNSINWAKGIEPTTSALEKCPVCEYSLCGLPVASRCPECGINYDENTRVWTAKQDSARALAVWLGIMVLFANAWIAGSWVVSGTKRRSPLSETVGTVIVAALGLVGIRNVAQAYRRSFVTTTPEGLLIRVAGSDNRRIPWPEIHGVEIIRFGRRVFTQVVLARSRRRLDLSSVLRKQEQAKEFEQCIQGYRQRRAETQRN